MVNVEQALAMVREYTRRRAKEDRVKPPMIRRAGRYVIAAHSLSGGRPVAEITHLKDVRQWCSDAVIAFERDREWKDAIDAMEDVERPQDIEAD